MSRQLRATCCTACRPAFNHHKTVPALRSASFVSPKAIRSSTFHSGLVWSNSSTKGNGSSSKIEQGLASKLFRRLLGEKTETEQSSGQEQQSSADPSVSAKVGHERLHVPLSRDVSSALQVPSAKKTKHGTTTVSPSTISARKSRLAARRQSKRTSKGQAMQHKPAKPISASNAGSNEDSSSSKSGISANKWQRRSVTPQEAKDRFDNLVKEFEIQPGFGGRGHDADDLDGSTVPDEIVEGQYSFFPRHKA